MQKPRWKLDPDLAKSDVEKKFTKSFNNSGSLLQIETMLQLEIELIYRAEKAGMPKGMALDWIAAAIKHSFVNVIIEALKAVDQHGEELRKKELDSVLASGLDPHEIAMALLGIKAEEQLPKMAQRLSLIRDNATETYLPDMWAQVKDLVAIRRRREVDQWGPASEWPRPNTNAEVYVMPPKGVPTSPIPGTEWAEDNDLGSLWGKTKH